MRIIRLLAFYLSLACVNLRAEEAPAPTLPDIIANSSFCIAYVIRDADARDSRPNHPGDPFADPSGEGIPYGSILRSDSLIDTAALVSRVVGQARIGKDQLATASKAVMDGNSRFPIMECYNPHHAIIFYSRDGNPVCCIEICFTCNQVKISPEIRNPTAGDGSYERADLIALAGLFSELKLPLTPFKSYEELKKGYQSLIEHTRDIK